MGGGLRPEPTVDLSIDVNIDLVVIVGTLAAVAIAAATVDLVGCTGARYFANYNWLRIATWDVVAKLATAWIWDCSAGKEGRADDVGHPNWLWLWL